jgi:hypothetical protein
VTEQDSNPNRWHPQHMSDDTSELPAESAAASAAAPRTGRRPAWLRSGRLLLGAAAAALLLVAGTGGFFLERAIGDDQTPSVTDRDGDDRGFFGDHGDPGHDDDGDDQRFVPQPDNPTPGTGTDTGTDIVFTQPRGQA